MAVATAFCALEAARPRDDFTVVFVGLAVLFGVSTVLYARQCLRVSSEGVIVQNTLRRHRLRWDEVVGFEATVPRNAFGTGAAVGVRRPDGGLVVAMASARWDKASVQSDVDELRRMRLERDAPGSAG